MAIHCCRATQHASTIPTAWTVHAVSVEAATAAARYGNSMMLAAEETGLVYKEQLHDTKA